MFCFDFGTLFSVVSRKSDFFNFTLHPSVGFEFHKCFIETRHSLTGVYYKPGTINLTSKVFGALQSGY